MLNTYLSSHSRVPVSLWLSDHTSIAPAVSSSPAFLIDLQSCIPLVSMIIPSPYFRSTGLIHADRVPFLVP